MLNVLVNDILPVFAILAIGFMLGRGRIVSLGEAKTLNRVGFIIFPPPLLILLIVGIDLDGAGFRALGIYFLIEVIGIVAIYWIMRQLFDAKPAEAALLGMCVVFVNSLLFLWPISALIYGDAGAYPIAAIVALDAIVIFGGYIIVLELWTGKSGALKSVRGLATNPVLVSIFLGLALNLSGLGLSEPLETGFRFVGGATAPLFLFALGVVLADQQIRLDPVIGVATLAKLILFPMGVWAGFWLLSPDAAWRELFVFNAAGPAGMMAFSLALIYGVRTDRIAPVIILTTVLSLISLAFLA